MSLSATQRAILRYYTLGVLGYYRLYTLTPAGAAEAQ